MKVVITDESRPENNLSTESKEEVKLTNSQRYICIFLALLLFSISAVLLLTPPSRSTTVEKNGVVETTKTKPEQSAVVVFLMTAGVFFTFYTINGLQVTKFSFGQFSAETKMAGNGKMPSPKDTSQGTTTNSAGISFDRLTEKEKKILRTLWRYQNKLFYGKFETLWTFTLYDKHPEYKEFLIAIGRLLQQNLIIEDPITNQYALDLDGIDLLKSIKDCSEINGDNYPFPNID